MHAMPVRRSAALASAVAYVALFGALTHPWWSTATYAVTPANDPRDTRLIIWILGWVAHALAHSPGQLFDAPIFFPAPGQLTGSEHLLSAQIVFGPVYGATGNPVLAANVAALLCLLASAFAMERLLAAQRLGQAAAWFGGLTFAIGLQLARPSLQSLQYPMFFLPLVALRVQRLRERPRAREVVFLALVLLAGMFASYYMAVLVALTAAAWGAFELWRCETQRGRFTAGVAASLLCAGLALAAASGPYLRRPLPPVAAVPAAGGPPVAAPRDLDVQFWTRAGWIALTVAARDPVWLGLVALAIGGAAASLQRRALDRALVATGVAFVGLGVVLFAFGWPRFLDPWLGFFRTRTRYLLLSSFGLSLLVALAFERLRWLLAWRRAGAVLLAALAGALVAGRVDLVAARTDVVLAAREREHYRRLGHLVREQGMGPLLELPFVSTAFRDGSPEAMVGQLEHGLPLVTGFTGYPPDHAVFLRYLLTTLPAPGVLDTLIDATHLRWILVRPADEWPQPDARQRFLDGLRTSATLGPSWKIGPWTAQRLDRVPRHETWFEALAAGPRAGHSVLGTSMAPLRPEAAIATVAARVMSRAPRAGRTVAVEVVAHNRGAAPWPAWASGGWDRPGLVRWETHWRRLDGDPASWAPAKPRPLRHDVAPGEVVSQRLAFPAPAAPGTYELRIAVRQRDGADFSAPGNTPARIRLDVAP